MRLPDNKDLAWYRRVGKAPPTHEEHGLKDTPDNPLSEQLLEAHPHNWHMIGNELHCDTDFGPLMQVIPPDYICLGDGENGLPLLKKVLE